MISTGDRGSCRSCGAPVVWVLHADTGRPAPLQPDDAGTWVVFVADDDHVRYRAHEPGRDGSRSSRRALARYRNHFATCPNAAEHRRAS